jgi:hypothetical protein
MTGLRLEDDLDRYRGLILRVFLPSYFRSGRRGGSEMIRGEAIWVRRALACSGFLMATGTTNPMAATRLCLDNINQVRSPTQWENLTTTAFLELDIRVFKLFKLLENYVFFKLNRINMT